MPADEVIDMSEFLSPDDLRKAGMAEQPEFVDIETYRQIFQESQDELYQLIGQPGSEINFDTSTTRGHIDAVNFAENEILVRLEDGILAGGDAAHMFPAYTEIKKLWERMPAQVMFNVLLQLGSRVVGAHLELRKLQDDAKEASDVGSA